MITLPTFEQVYQFYDSLTRHYVPGPQSWSFFASPLLLFIALLIPRSRLSHAQLAAFFLPLIYACTLHAWSAIGGVEVLSVTTALWATALLGCNDGRTFRRLRNAEPASQAPPNDVATWSQNKDDTEHSVEEFPESLWARIGWICTLLVSLRLTGWQLANKTEEARHAQSRTAFALHALRFIVVDFLLLDTTFLYVKHDPYFTTSGMEVDEPFPVVNENTPALIKVLWTHVFPRCVRCTMLAAQVFAMVSGMFYLPTLPAAALNGFGLLPDEWSPHSWPHFFGDFMAIGKHGLRGMWGRWWHQINRIFVSSPGKALVESMGLQRGSLLRYGCLVITSFFFSGVLHAGLIPPEPLGNAMSVDGMRLSVATFFWIQAAGIVFETSLENIVRRLWTGKKYETLARGIYFGWTAAWLSMTLPLLTAPFREIGYWQASPVGNGILQPIIDRFS